jgi:hypothetical protein
VAGDPLLRRCSSASEKTGIDGRVGAFWRRLHLRYCQQVVNRATSDDRQREAASGSERIGILGGDMADDSLFTKVQLQTPQIESDRALLRDEDLMNEEHLRRMDQVLLRRNLDHARIFSRKYSLQLQQYVHLYTPEANELRRKIEKYMVMERMIEREMARRHTY